MPLFPVPCLDQYPVSSSLPAQHLYQTLLRKFFSQIQEQLATQHIPGLLQPAFFPYLLNFYTLLLISGFSHSETTEICFIIIFNNQVKSVISQLYFLKSIIADKFFRKLK